MNKKIGVNKEIDKLGRLLIPKKLRILYNINHRAELIATE